MGISNKGFIIDTSRDGQTTERANCSNWCSISNALIPHSLVFSPFSLLLFYFIFLPSRYFFDEEQISKDLASESDLWQPQATSACPTLMLWYGSRLQVFAFLYFPLSVLPLIPSTPLPSTSPSLLRPSRSRSLLLMLTIGESDGTSDKSAQRFDYHCASPDRYKSLSFLSPLSPSLTPLTNYYSFIPAPEAGMWFPAFFIQLAQLANPPL